MFEFRWTNIYSIFKCYMRTIKILFPFYIFRTKSVVFVFKHAVYWWQSSYTKERGYSKLNIVTIFFPDLTCNPYVFHFFYGLFVSNHFTLFYSVLFVSSVWEITCWALWGLNYSCSNFWTLYKHFKNGSMTPYLSFNNYPSNIHVLVISLKETEESPSSAMWLWDINTIQDQIVTKSDALNV